MEEYLQFVHEVCELHCQDAANFDSASLRRQLKELLDGFTSRHQLVTAPHPATLTEVPSPRRGTPRRDSDDLPNPVPSKKKVHYNATDRIALQRFRDGEIGEGNHTNLPDQGIRFDKDGRPWDKYKSPSRDSRREKSSSGPPRRPAPSHAGSKGSPEGGDSGGDSSDEHSMSGTSSDEGEDSNSPSSDDEGNSGKHSRRKRSGNSKSFSYRGSSYRRARTSDAERYREGSSRRPSKYLKAMHKKFHKQIDRKVSVLSDSPALGGKNGPRVPNPPKYGGLQDSEEFERWLSCLLRWLKVNKICGPENDSDRIEFTAMFLENTASVWFEDNVDGAYRQCSTWTFKEVITGLYDRFVHDNATHDTNDKFWHVEYNAREGVMSYYCKLERYATRMIEAPDVFTFRTQLVAGLPDNIIAFILDKGCTAETSSVDDILYFAHEAEEIGKMTKRFKEKKRIMESTKSKSTSSSSKPAREVDHSQERSHERSGDRYSKHDKPSYRERFKHQSSSVHERRPRSHDDKSRPRKDRRQISGEKSSRSKDLKSDVKSDDRKAPTCYSCGGPHYSSDKKCPKYGQPKPAAKMYAAREESVTESDHRSNREREQNPSSNRKGPGGQPGPKSNAGERLAAAYSDSEENSTSEYSSAVSDLDPVGSQYSSDGELYDYESEYGSSTHEPSASERFGAIREIPSEYHSDSCPSAQSVSESEDSEDEPVVPKISPFRERLGVMVDNLFNATAKFRGPRVLRKSSKKIVRPPRTEKDNRCFVAKMKLHDLEAYVLLDSGCTSDSTSPEFATSANLKVHELEEPVPLQLGTVGSRSKINFGLFSDFEIGEIKGNHYFDVVNIDRYDVIVGTVFMRKHGIVLDFERDEVRVKGKVLETIVEGESTFQQVHRYMMQPHPPKGE